jgi:hypothetical protein
MMGLFPLPRAGMLGGTIAGGAPVVDPSAAVAGPFGQQNTHHHQQQGYGSPEVRGAAAGDGSGVAFGSPDLPGAPAADAAPAATPADVSMELTGATAAAAAAAGDSSPVMGIWQGQQQLLTPQSAAQQQQQQQRAAASPAADQGSEPTLELAGAASQGGQTNALEDATLEDFALPPDLAAGEERPITMPFSGDPVLKACCLDILRHGCCTVETSVAHDCRVTALQMCTALRFDCLRMHLHQVLVLVPVLTPPWQASLSDCHAFCPSN